MVHLRLSGNGDVMARKKAVTANKTPTCSSTRPDMENLEPMNLATNMQEKETQIERHNNKYRVEGSRWDWDWAWWAISSADPKQNAITSLDQFRLGWANGDLLLSVIEGKGSWLESTSSALSMSVAAGGGGRGGSCSDIDRGRNWDIAEMMAEKSSENLGATICYK